MRKRKFDMVDGLFFTAIAIMLILTGILIYASIADNSLDTYERTYAQCVAREHIGADYCHDIAVQDAYGKK